MEYLLLVTILLPIIGAFVAGLLPPRGASRLAVLIALLTAAVAVFAGIGSFPGRSELRVGALQWFESLADTELFGVLLDPLSLLMLLVVVLIGFLVVVYSQQYVSAANLEHPLETGQSRYYFWLLLFIGAMTGVALSPTLLQLFIFWELTTICSWALISHTHERHALRSGYKALLMTHIGGLGFLIALVILCVSAGSVEFGALSAVQPGLAGVLFGLLLIAAWAKAAQVPFYTWLPDAMTAPTPISCYLHAAAMVKAGVYLLARVVLANPGLPENGAVIAIVAALVTMTVTVFLYFFQTDLKRLLALSTISQLSYIIVGISLGAVGSTLAYRGAILHIVGHAAAKGLLFLCVGAVAYATGKRSMSDLSGVGARMPLVMVCFIVGFLGVAGVPPLGTFWSKFYIITGAFAQPDMFGPFVGAFLLAESMVVFGWFLHVTHSVFFGTASEAAESAQDPPWQMSGPLVALAVLVMAAPLAALAVVRYLM